MKLRVLLLAVLLVLVAGQVLAQTPVKKVVVNNFSVVGASAELGTAASVALQGVLVTFDDSGYEIEKREVVNDLLAGSGLGLTALLNKQKVRSLAPDFIIDGTLTLEQGLYQLDLILTAMPAQTLVRQHSISAGSIPQLMEKLPELALILLDISRTISAEPVRLLPADDLTYHSWYSDASGVHKGGKIVLHVDGETVTGTSIESYGQAQMSGRIQGTTILGIYQASYGYGNFEFEIRDNGTFLEGTYYQVSNGAKGEWSGRLP